MIEKFADGFTNNAEYFLIADLIIAVFMYWRY